MVRTRLEIKYIENKSRRHTAFTKRRQGLIKKTKVFAGKFNAKAAAIVFSKAGNVFAFGHPSVDSLVSQYLAETFSESELAASGGGGVEEKAAALTEEEAGKRIGAALERGNWNLAVEGLGPRQIDELLAEIMKIKRAVAARTVEVAARGYN
ncbi:agamous-like mads-box protein agl18 [Phtheirospermum japonicum]|uniref:Agamous-like mads-box protein agl18 n=1 Tax=Phtheirospermum japonicum TaxID=374723 RepID=A0A830B665_9LAMI|nr:agamous-like mads-box protein agl18 [Phtheirospermum japonicum]